jgi:hypothetical protein
MSGYLASKTTKVQVELSYEQSEHACFYVELHINEKITMGQGLTRTNATLLNDYIYLVWDPHEKLENIKVLIRSLLAQLGSSRKELKQEIEELEESLNDMHRLKVKACSLGNEEEKTRKPILIDNALN